MAIFNNPFDSYQLFFYSGAAAAYPVTIQVYQAGLQVGRIAFYPEYVPFKPVPPWTGPSPLEPSAIKPAQVPANGVINPLGTDIPSVFFPLSRLEAILTTLREEKPLYLFLDTVSGVGMLATSEAEPVGENEG